MQNLKLNLSSNFDNNLLSDSDYEEDSTPAGLRAHRNSCQRAVVQRRRVGQRTTSENNISQQYRCSCRARSEGSLQGVDAQVERAEGREAHLRPRGRGRGVHHGVHREQRLLRAAVYERQGDGAPGRHHLLLQRTHAGRQPRLPWRQGELAEGREGGRGDCHQGRTGTRAERCKDALP